MSVRLLPAQIRRAPGMLDWSMIDLAKAAGVSVSTIERAKDVQPQSVPNNAFFTIQGAFEPAGVYFLEDMGERVGMRLQRR